METLLTYLTEALYENTTAAVLASFGWGMLSVLLSPCHLMSVPLLVGFLMAQHEGKTRGLALASVFAAGIVLSIAIIGTLTIMSGGIAGDLGPYGKYGGVLVFLFAGLSLMDVLRIPRFMGRRDMPHARSAAVSALGLGALSGGALGPCTFAFMAPVLAVSFRMASASVPASVAVVAAFAAGHCGVIILAGGFSSRLKAYLAWTGRSKAVLMIKRGSGVLVVLAGLYTLLAA